jgi:hypothetical protein
MWLIQPTLATVLRNARRILSVWSLLRRERGGYDVNEGDCAMIELTEQQRQELDAPEPVAIDPQTRREYVLIRREIYERLRGLVDADDVRLMEPLLANLDPEDWEDASHYEGKP